MLLFDAHSHLSVATSPDETSPGPRLHQVVCGTCESDWAAVLAHASGNGRITPMLGLHPWFVAEAAPEWAERLESLLRAHRVGLGECGLDFTRKETNKAAQEAAFRTQLRLAHGLGRPVAMHVVRAWGCLLELLREEGIPPAGAMVHAYSGSPETAQALQSMGVFLSFSGDLLAPDHTKVRESMLSVDPSHLLLETDGTADLARVIAAAADLRGVSEGNLAEQTWENGYRCFLEWLA